MDAAGTGIGAVELPSVWASVSGCEYLLWTARPPRAPEGPSSGMADGVLSSSGGSESLLCASVAELSTARGSGPLPLVPLRLFLHFLRYRIARVMRGIDTTTGIVTPTAIVTGFTFEPLPGLELGVRDGTWTNVDVTVIPTVFVKVVSMSLVAVAVDPEMDEAIVEAVPELGSGTVVFVRAALVVPETDMAVVDDTAKGRFNALLADPQQVPLPLKSQQKPPFGITESSHSTTNLFVPVYRFSDSINKTQFSLGVPMQNEGQIAAL